MLFMLKIIVKKNKKKKEKKNKGVKENIEKMCVFLLVLLLII